MTKILILNVGWSNKGNVALIDSTMDDIKKNIPDAKFRLVGTEITSYKDIKVKKISPGMSINKPFLTLISIFYLFQCIYINVAQRFIQVSIPKKSPLHLMYYSDLIINSGGDQLSGELGVHAFGTFINILYAILLNKPVVLYGESLGYFKNPIVNYTAKLILNRTNMILVRESLSKRYLDENNINKPDIYVTSDPAFLLSPVSKSHINEILRKEGINNIKKPIVGINASGLISKYRKNSNNETELVDIFAKAIDYVIENLNVSILMIPHVYSKTDDDRTSIETIYDKTKNKSHIKVIMNEYSPQELKGIIGKCDLFIGARMHATIAATSMFVPTIGIAYSHKMYGIIGETLGQKDYILDINEVNYYNLILKINNAWGNREEIKRELEQRIPKVKEKAMLNGKLVKELIDTLKKS